MNIGGEQHALAYALALVAHPYFVERDFGGAKFVGGKEPLESEIVGNKWAMDLVPPN